MVIRLFEKAVYAYIIIIFFILILEKIKSFVRVQWTTTSPLAFYTFLDLADIQH